MSPIRVFISYSHDPDPGGVVKAGGETPHRQRVEALALMLRADGFDVFVDQWAAPASWTEEIREELVRADAIVCVCTEEYRKRFDGAAPHGDGRGVADEGAYVENEMARVDLDRIYALQMTGTKFRSPGRLAKLTRHDWPSGHEEFAEALRRPTVRRRLLGVLSRGFGEDIARLDAWARHPDVGVGHPGVEDVEVQRFQAVDDVLLEGSPERLRTILEALLDALSEEDERVELQAIAKELKLAPLKVPAKKSHSVRPPVGPAKGREPIRQDELEEYKRQARARHKGMRFLGFSTTVPVSIQLEEIHVELDAMADGPRGGRGKLDGLGDEFMSKVKLSEAFSRARRGGRRGVVVEGW